MFSFFNWKIDVDDLKDVLEPPNQKMSKKWKKSKSRGDQNFGPLSEYFENFEKETILRL